MQSDMMSGPVMFYPPAPVLHYFPHNRAHCVRYTPSPEPPQSRAPPMRPQLTQQRSRKRSRDQLEDDERQAAFHEENTMDTSAPAPEPIYGEGMVLLDPVTMRPIGNNASSSTGTWHEAQLEEERRASAAAAEQLARDKEEMARAVNRPSKASRLDLAGCSSSETRAGSPSTIPGLIAPTPLTPETPSAPTYDEAAMLLGVGWRKVDSSSDPALAGASKGWAKVIDNHFGGLRHAEILAKSDGKEAFLVKAHDMAAGADGWYLFSEKLDEGQLLSRDIDAAIRNLHSGHFEGPHLSARASPEPLSQPMLAQSSLPAEIAMEM